MPKQRAVGMRMTDELIERIDRLAPKLALAIQIPGVTVTRSDVLRAAIERRLADLEGEAAPHLPENR